MKNAAMAVLLAVAFVVATQPVVQAKTFQLGTQESSSLVPAEAINCPQPAVTTEMMEQGVKTNCLAKFAIEPTGKHTVELLTSTGSGEVDEMTLETLRTWKFRPASLSGAAVQSVRKIKIEFEVD